MRLHANLLFYGLDQGTWSDPPSGSNNTGWTKSPWDSADLTEVSWGGAADNLLLTPSTAVNSVSFGNEQSTDEGSEAKGSESDSLPDSNEGYLVSNHQQFSTSPPPMLPFMSTTAANLCGSSATGVMAAHSLQVPAHSSTTSDYSQYLPPGSFMATHGFASDVASHYTYEVGPALSTSFAPLSTVAPSVIDTAGVPVSVGDAQGTDGVPSLGSYAHLSGQCSRCCFHPKGRCANGYSCEFCHYDHDKRPRNGKKKRYRRQLDGTIEDDMGFLVAGLD